MSDFPHQFIQSILTEDDPDDKKNDFGIFRTGSAPPIILAQDPDEVFRYDPSDFQLYPTQRALNPRLPPQTSSWRHPLYSNTRDTEKKDWVDSVKVDNGSNSPSLVDRIQEDFPSTPSSLYKKQKKPVKPVKKKEKIIPEKKKEQTFTKLMEDFKSGKGKKFELKDITGFVVEFSKDQHGSRFIQQKLENASGPEKDFVFGEILQDALSLMTDVFGNYVIQKFFEYGLSSHRKQLVKVLTGHVLTLTLQTYGCRVIQKALEVIDDDDKGKIALELDGNIMKCVQDQNGNHVIQKCIEKISQKNIQFVVDSFAGQVYTLATHAYGCRVIQRILEYCTETQCKVILDEILTSATKLVMDQYGNYVVQHVLEHSKPKYKLSVIKQFKGLVLLYSSHKFASNVIERCFKNGGKKERQDIIDEIIKPTEKGLPVLEMINDSYGNYVVQKIIELAEDQRGQIIECIKQNIVAIKKLTYGKHIIMCCEKYVKIQ